MMRMTDSIWRGQPLWPPSLGIDMGTSQADKAASHERIIDAAATQIRRGGVGSLNVASLMSDAGLTHGGFYRHFASRDARIDHRGRRDGPRAKLERIPSL